MRTSSSLHRALPLLCNLGIVLAVYGRVITFEFLRWDDFHLIVENPLVRNFSPKIFWTFDPELYIPLTLLTYQIEHALAGYWPPLFHATNLFLHLANTALAYLLLKRLNADDVAALFAALFFALHPLQTESVAWVSARKELLWMTCALAATLLHLKDRRTPALLLFVCALLSKVTAAMLPLGWIILAWAQKRRIDRLTVVPALVMSVVTIGIAVIGKQHTVDDVGFVDGVLLALRSAAFTLKKIVVPIELSAVYPASPSTLTNVLPAALGLTVTTLAAWMLRKKLPMATAGIVLAALFLLPSLAALERSNELALAADRYAYGPLFGIALVLSSLSTIFPYTRRTLVFLGFFGFFGLLGFLSYRQSLLWHTTETLFRDVLLKAPNSIVAKNNLGFRLMSEGKTDEAEQLFRDALESNPHFTDALVNLAVIEGKRNRLSEAEYLLRKALEADPHHAQAHFNLGGVYFQRGAYESAAREYHTVLELKPDYAPAVRQLTEAQKRL
jgi:protein O-mannosyl-transferase